jgi:hypothetical protein
MFARDMDFVAARGNDLFRESLIGRACGVCRVTKKALFERTAVITLPVIEQRQLLRANSLVRFAPGFGHRRSDSLKAAQTAARE